MAFADVPLLGIDELATSSSATKEPDSGSRGSSPPAKHPLACEHVGHVAAERPGDRDDDKAKQRDLQPSIAGHGGAPTASRDS